MGNLEASHFMRSAQGSPPRASIIRSFNLGVIGMFSLRRTLAAAALSLATLVPAGYAAAADLPVKAKVKPIADVPFFFVIDDRVSYSYIFNAAQPGAYTV